MSQRDDTIGATSLLATVVGDHSKSHLGPRDSVTISVLVLISAMHSACVVNRLFDDQGESLTFAKQVNYRERAWAAGSFNINCVEG